MIRAEKDNWDKHWEQYATAAGINPAQRMRHSSILTALRAGEWPTRRLLDVGSGQGDFLLRATRAGAAQAYAGFEISESGIKVSRDKVPQANFIQIDLFAPTQESDSFENWATVAVCSEVIEHVDDPVGFLQSLRHYMMSGATLVLTVPAGPMSQFDHEIGHRHHYTKAQAREVLMSAGFDVEATWLAGFPFFNLYRLAVVLRGARLSKDAKSAEHGGTTSKAAKIALAMFGFLFRFNLPNCALGWQVVALARKR